MNVAVFCSSSNQVSPVFFSEIEILAQQLAEAGHTIVYGGANVGVMGRLADAALAKGGQVVGVIPEMDFAKDQDHHGLSERIVVSNIFERKEVMISRADAFVIFPGGIGTLDEAFEVLTLRQIGALDKPIVFVDVLGFWQPVLEALGLIEQQRMITGSLPDLFAVVDRAQDVVNCLHKQLTPPVVP